MALTDRGIAKSDDDVLPDPAGRSRRNATLEAEHRPRQPSPCAFQVRQQLAALVAERDACKEILDCLPLGVVLVDAAANALLLNRAAADLVAASDGLALAGGRLTATRPADTAALVRLVNRAARPGGSGGALALARPGAHDVPLAVLVAPLLAGTLGGMAAIFAAAPERDADTPGDLLTRLYGLTPAEAALAAALVQGEMVERVAARLGVGLCTVRTHLQRVYDKTNTHRQSELVRRLLQGPAGLRFERLPLV